MRKYNPFRNIFYYYRGPSERHREELDRQIEDNTTKALINTLEYGAKNALLMFLKEVGIPILDYEKTYYDLQVAGKESRPDALISIDNHSIFIESKISSALNANQIFRHLQIEGGQFLLCITPRDSDKNIIQNIGKNKLKFISWKDVYRFFKKQLEYLKEKESIFIIQQFLEYLEAINMSPFNGWSRKDFEAFLNIEDDPKRELRLRVKEKLNQYLIELKEILSGEKLFDELLVDVGNIKQESKGAWGVLCKPPLSTKVHKVHFNFWIESNEFGIGVLMEGKNASNKMKEKIIAQKDKFLEILQELEEFDFFIRKRVNPMNRPRGFYGIEVIKIKCGDDIRIDDINYLISKMKQYDLCELHCIKSFKRDDKAIEGQTFLQSSAEIMKRLQRFYDFSST